MPSTWPEVPNFSARSSRVLVRESESKDQPAGDPGTILIFGWGNAVPKHVAKFSNGYERLFPSSRQILILSPISSTVYSGLERRTEEMNTVLDALMENNEKSGSLPRRTLVHCMSNTGGIAYASLLNAYWRRTGGPLPHELFVLDSTPGTPYLTVANLFKWSAAMTLNTAGQFPWPAIITRILWAVFLCSNELVDRLAGRQSAAEYSVIALNDKQLETKGADRLYLYGESDLLISSRDVEDHAAKAREKGYQVKLVHFDRSGHVDHMRMSPELYWSSIATSWSEAIRH